MLPMCLHCGECFKTINSFSNYILTFIAINKQFTPIAIHSYNPIRWVLLVYLEFIRQESEV